LTLDLECDVYLAHVYLAHVYLAHDAEVLFMLKRIIARISTTALAAVAAVMGSAAPAHAELVLSPEDPSVILALVGGSAAALPFVVRGVRAHLKNRKKQLRAPER